MIIYKKIDDEKILDYIQCDKCRAICNKFDTRGGLHITFPTGHPTLSKISEDDKLKGKDFCSHHCAILFLEDCQKEIFKLSMKKFTEADK